MIRVVFDAGALIALERGVRAAALLVKQTLSDRDAVVVPSCVVAQVWRGGPRQARLSTFLGSPAVVVEPFDERLARAAGVLCGLARTSDIVDASVVLAARAHEVPVATSDADDLLRLDPSVRIIGV